MLEKLKEDVYEANISLKASGLVVLTWGNVSAIDRERGLIVIKPSGVDYDNMTPDDMVVVDINGNIVEGRLRPSSDLPTHLELYKAFPNIGGVAHTHSRWATIFAQACSPIPAFGTTHADAFYGDVPATRLLTTEEIADDYEAATGRVIVEAFGGLDPMAVPAVLVSSHGPFTWGVDAKSSVKNSIILEECAMMAWHTMMMNGSIRIQSELLDKHFYRKHGPGAYYGQEEEK